MSFSELGYCFMEEADTEAMSRMNNLEPSSRTPVHTTSQFGWQISTAPLSVGLSLVTCPAIMF